MKIGFIGCGNMGSALCSAINSIGGVSLLISDTNQKKLDEVCALIGAKSTSNSEIAKSCDFIFLAVKPNILPFVAEEIKDTVPSSAVIVSMAAGISTESLNFYFGEDKKIIRIMPNTPVEVSSGVTFYTKYKISEDMLHKFIEVMSYTGSLYEIVEDKMDVVSVLTGSTPAYLDYFIDALSEFGLSKGFTKEESIEYVLKMALGTILLNLSSNKSPKELGDEVCSPGGSTIEGVKVLLDNDFYKIINDAANASYNKNKKML